MYIYIKHIFLEIILFILHFVLSGNTINLWIILWISDATRFDIPDVKELLEGFQFIINFELQSLFVEIYFAICKLIEALK